MHIADPRDAGNPGANGIVGGGMGIAAGAAPYSTNENTGKIVRFFGGRRNQRRCSPRSGQYGFYLESPSNFLPY